MIKTIICDMDGLLSDTETLHLKAYQQTLAHFGHTLTDHGYIDLWIRDGQGIAQYVEREQLSLDPLEVHNHKLKVFWQMLETDLIEMPYATDFLERMSNSYRLLLASSSYSKNVLFIIKKLGMEHFFELCAFKESANPPKPDPGIFLYLTNTLKLNPTECLVIEDAQKGIIAAHAAGMKSIAVPNQYTADNDFSLADNIVKSLHEIDFEIINSL